MNKKEKFGEITERDEHKVFYMLAIDNAFITEFPHFVIFYDMLTSVEYAV